MEVSYSLSNENIFVIVILFSISLVADVTVLTDEQKSDQVFLSQELVKLFFEVSGYNISYEMSYDLRDLYYTPEQIASGSWEVMAPGSIDVSL